MEDYFYHVIPLEFKDFFGDNEEAFQRAQPDVYDAMKALADILDLDVKQTLAVNAITEFSTYCTSIVARTEDGLISHVRNLDFDYTSVMKTLIYDAILVKDGEEKAHAPSIAGYYGAYTGHKHDAWSVSYNVRESTDYPSPE